MTNEQIQTVKSTVPLLADRGEELTKHFYRRMFLNNPEVKAYFNQAHQQGSQQRALAAAICAYAQHLEEPKVLGPAIEVIAHKHASLGVKPEHYPIVGEHLLASIQELFDLPANDPILIAWEAAYAILAKVFVDREREIYAAHEDWQGFRSLKVVDRVRESDEVLSFYLGDSKEKLPSFLPGQYITVRIPNDETGTTMRNYSLSDEPGKETYRISVKREGGDPRGYVSNYLHDKIGTGDLLEVGPPCGEFTLPQGSLSNKSRVFLAGGIGVTPLISMAKASVKTEPDRPIYFLQGARHSGCHAFSEEIRKLVHDNQRVTSHVLYSDPKDGDECRCDGVGFYDLDTLKSVLPSKDCEYFCCGPNIFMRNVVRDLKIWGVSDEDIHFEFFGPKDDLN